MLKVLLISHYDPLIEPYIFLKVPDSVEREDLSQIPDLMDVYDSGFYKHDFNTFKTLNLLFEIPSEYSRSKKEKLCISLVYDVKSKLNLSLAEELLRNFVNEVKKIDALYKALYINSKIYKGDSNKLNEIKFLLQSFYETFPDENIIFEQKEAKILIFGLSLAGKTTLIRQLRESISTAIFPTISVDISRIIINNISLLTYDTPGQPKLRAVWKNYLKEQDGLIFVLDVTDKIKFSDARALLHDVANMPELKELPLLILFNKADLIKPDTQSLVQSMELNKLENRPVKYFLTSGTRNLNIEEAFKWLALKVTEKVKTTQVKSDLSLIFCNWDENIGVKIASLFPSDAFNDPELIAVRCFSIAQFIFGAEEFKRTTVILPFPHLKANAAIYFDFASNKSIRGGVLPLCLILYYDEKIPKGIIDRFNSYIFDQFGKLKDPSLTKENLTNILSEIHTTILNQIDTLNPTMQALKIAEIRYESLFKGARDAILIIDRKSGIIIDANSQAEQLFEIPFEDLIGLHASQLLTASDTLTDDFKTILYEKVNKPLPFTVEIINASGTVIPVEINVNEVQMAGQWILQCIIRNISERITADKTIKNSETKYQRLFQDSPLSILLIDPKGFVIDVNPHFEKELGYSKKELLGKKFVDLSIIDKEFLVDVLKRFTREERQKPQPPMELKLYKKDGTIIWSFFQSSFVDIGKKRFYQIVGQNITEQKEIEQDLKRIIQLVSIIARISSRFITVKNINEAINDSLEEIGDLLNSSFAYIYILEDNTIILKRMYEWQGKLTFPPIFKPPTLTLNDFPWLINSLLNDDFTYIKALSELPDEAKGLKMFLDSQKIQSCLFVPLKIDNKLKGFIGFDNLSKIRGLKQENFMLLGIFSEILKNIVQQKREKEALQKSEDQFHKEYDRTYFYRELFVSDVTTILKKIQSSIEIYRPYVKLQSIQELFNDITRLCYDGEQLVSIIKKIVLLEESSAPVSKLDLYNLLNEAIKNVLKIFPEKKIEIYVETSENDLSVHAGDFLIDVFENLLTTSIKHNNSQNIEFKIDPIKFNDPNTKQSYIRIEFIDYKKDISNIEKEKFLKQENAGDNKAREVLLAFVFIERILEHYNGRIWVEGNNFVVLIPSV